MIPGWQSPESAEAYAKFFKYAGYLALFLLFVFEVVADVYSNHREALLAKLAQRSLSTAQQHQIRESMKPFSGETVYLSSYPNDGEEPGQSEPDCDTAIALALRIAKAGDAVLIAGKGHEDYQLVAGRVLPFDDRVVVREIAAELGGGQR